MGVRAPVDDGDIGEDLDQMVHLKTHHLNLATRGTEAILTGSPVDRYPVRSTDTVPHHECFAQIMPTNRS